MRLPWRTKLLAARARHRAKGDPLDREALIREHAPGKSFADIGALWGVHGRMSFVAEEAGATAVTAVDVSARSAEFDAEHGERDSRVLFVQGDFHDPAVLEQIGVHDVVFCAGVLYHAPNPLLALERLRSITGETLILQSAGIPELPGAAQGMVFLPGLSEPDRRLYGIWGSEVDRRIGHMPASTSEYGPWWWGLSKSATAAMIEAAGFERPREISGHEFAMTFVAKPR